MALIDDLKAAQIAAMRAKDKTRLGTIRMIMAEIKQREVDGQKTLGEEEILAVLTKMVKQRRDAAQQYQDAGREDLYAQEQAEIAVLDEFLPQPLSVEEIQSLIQEAIQASGAANMQDMGKVMGVLKPKLQGRADMGAVSQTVRAQLAG